MEIDDFMFDLNKKIRRAHLEALRKSNKYGRDRDTFIVSDEFFDISTMLFDIWEMAIEFDSKRKHTEKS